MGYETKCRVRVDDGSGTVRQAENAAVLLETDDLIVRGEARVKVPRASIQQVAARGGLLTVTSPAAVVTLTLDAEAAARWKAKLEAPPRRLIDKLDVKPGAKVWLFGALDAELAAQVTERAASVLTGSRAAGCDVVFVSVESARDLARIARARAAITDDGAIWVVHRKGAAGVADTTIFAEAKQLGLTYTKVARVSDTHTAEKLVIPVAGRRR